VNEYSLPFVYQLYDNRVAIEQEYIENVTKLLGRGADVNDKDDKGMTALMWAAKLGFPDLARLLIERGAALDERDRNGEGYTALSHAVWKGSVEVARQLVDAGIDLGMLDRKGERLIPLNESEKHVSDSLKKDAETIRQMLAEAPEMRRHVAVSRKQGWLKSQAAKKQRIRLAS
jgi:ankyrin repeat protein